MQKAYFPMRHLRITQKAYSTYSHAGSMALDLGGQGGGKDPVYCPFDAKVVRCRANASGEMFIESIAPVLWADGTQDYMHMTLLHADSFRFKEGDIIPQGTHFYDEGGMGGGKAGAFASHLHLEVGRGHSPAYQKKNNKNTWYTPEQVPIESALWLRPGTVVIDDGGYSWRIDETPGELVSSWLLVTADNCEYFGQPDINDAVGKLPKGDAYEITAQGAQELGGIWVQVKEGAGLWWVLALDDRTQIVQGEPTDESKPGPVQPEPCTACAKLQETIDMQVKELATVRLELATERRRREDAYAQLVVQDAQIADMQTALANYQKAVEPAAKKRRWGK
ncbi:hypothetical protein LJB77_03260 [Ruminococcaceae bacterium OttesenSCG-928-N02]|nr:hypothetical protein [Ruminococcaceae bacterium OttesenSCG-928-N02]